MKLYCNIKNITLEDNTNAWIINQGPCELPECANNVSNLNALDDETLKIFGWVPLEIQTDDKPVVVATEYDVFPDKVVKRIITRDKTEEEINSEKESNNFKEWEKLRDKRNLLLQESDKLVVIDRWEKLSIEQKQHLAEYRQALRDLPTQSSDPQLITFPVL